MNQSTNAVPVEEYVALQKSQRWQSVSSQRLALVRKSYAQQLARSASEAIEDRRKRAEIKIEIYNHLMPMLEMHEREHASMRRYYQKILMALCGTLTVALLAIAVMASLI